MTLAKVKARANETFVVQASLTIVTYKCQNIFIVQATAYNVTELVTSAKSFVKQTPDLL